MRGVEAEAQPRARRRAPAGRTSRWAGGANGGRRRPGGRALAPTARPAARRPRAGRGCRRRSGRRGGTRRRTAPARPPASRRGSARGSGRRAPADRLRQLDLLEPAPALRADQDVEKFGIDGHRPGKLAQPAGAPRACYHAAACPSGGRNPVSTEVPIPNPEFWRGRRVFVTGHTGFKGSLARARGSTTLGAEVHGYALAARPRRASSRRARAGRRHALARSATCATSRPLRAAIARSPARDRVPPRRAVARARVLRAIRSTPTRPTSWARCTCSTPRAGAAACAPSSSSPATSATRTASGRGPTARTTPLGGHDPYSQQQGAARSWSTTAYRDSFFGAAGRAVALATRRAPATSSAAATGRATASCPTSSARAVAGEPVLHPQSRTRSAPGSTCSSRSRAICMLAERAARATATQFADGWNFGPRRGRRAAGRLDRRARSHELWGAPTSLAPQDGARIRTRRIYLQARLLARRARGSAGSRALGARRGARLDRRLVHARYARAPTARRLTARADRALRCAALRAA